MKLAFAFLLIGLVSFSFVGCASSGSAKDDINPQRLTLKVYRATQTKQYTYFELKTSGELFFAGGRNARQRIAKPIMTLNRQQIDGLLAVIEKHGLLKAESAPFGAKPKDVEIEASMRSRLGWGSFRSVDGSVDGAKELHDLLFKYQADERYKLPSIQGHYDHAEER